MNDTLEDQDIVPNYFNKIDTTDRVITNDSREFSYENIFDRLEVRIIFIILYFIVFSVCVLGNLLVILVVMLSRKLRSTEFFLGNLAIADLCVGIFCILQTISSYLTSTWIFGEFLCKMHYFIHSLSCTASIFILVVISIERYLAIIHPIRSRQIMTLKRLKSVIVLIWAISTAYSSPRFIFAKAISHSIQQEVEVICIVSRIVYNSELFDVINFVILYLIPLCIMIILYTRIAIKLWNSARDNSTFQKHRERCRDSGTYSFGPMDHSSITMKFNEEISGRTSGGIGTGSRRQEFSVTGYASRKNIIQTRRGVIRMLILVVFTFAVCNIPFHARKMWQYWSESYNASSAFSTLFTPLTFLFTYCNSAINPMLYAFCSRNFRKAGKFALVRGDHVQMNSKKSKSMGKVNDKTNFIIDFGMDI